MHHQKTKQKKKDDDGDGDGDDDDPIVIEDDRGILSEFF